VLIEVHCGGTSLSAIMLGRLRMDVSACLDLYAQLGDEIFGHPRRVHIGGHPFIGRWWWPRSKYNCKKLEQLLQTTIRRIIGPQAQDGQKDDYFPSEEDKCRT